MENRKKFAKLLTLFFFYGNQLVVEKRRSLQDFADNFNILKNKALSLAHESEREFIEISSTKEDIFTVVPPYAATDEFITDEDGDIVFTMLRPNGTYESIREKLNSFLLDMSIGMTLVRIEEEEFPYISSIIGIEIKQVEHLSDVLFAMINSNSEAAVISAIDMAEEIADFLEDNSRMKVRLDCPKILQTVSVGPQIETFIDESLISEKIEGIFSDLPDDSPESEFSLPEMEVELDFLPPI